MRPLKNWFADISKITPGFWIQNNTLRDKVHMKAETTAVRGHVLAVKFRHELVHDGHVCPAIKWRGAGRSRSTPRPFNLSGNGSRQPCLAD